MTQRMESYNKGLAREMKSCSHTLAILFEYAWSKARRSLEAGKSMARVWLGGSELRSLRYAACLILIVVGVGEMWGQETPDYSGTYYLANNNKGDYKGYDKADNFYLCAAQEYYDSDNGAITTTQNATPFLTTFKTRQTEQSLWIVERVGNTNYYTFKQKEGNHYRYLTVNDAISSLGDGKKHRRRVHLEEFSTTQLTNRNYFTFTQIATHQDGVTGYSIGCHSDYIVATGRGYLNPPSGNFNQYNASNDDSGGIVGFFTIGTTSGDGRGSVWFFEVPKPIMHIDGNNQLSFTCADEDVTYHCTIDSNEAPTKDSAEYTNITLTEGLHTIMVMAVKANGLASGVVTYQARVFSTEHPYLISNNQSPWTTVGGESQYIYYMIPSDNNTVNTTSMPRPSMEWYIDFAEDINGERYFNFRNAKTGDYLYRTDDNIYMKTSLEKTTLENDADNGFKFYLIKRTDGYSIIPYGETSKYLNKNSGNNNAAVVALGTNNNEYSKWNFVVKTDLIKDLNSTPPFTPSGEDTSLFYKIKNGAQNNSNDYYIIPPATVDGNATASMDATESSMSWYFIQVQDPTNDDWLTYYKIVNAETGKALYYNYVNNNSNCLKTGDYEENNGNYMFAFVKSPTTNYYYIVPKSLVNDQQVASIYTFYRNNSKIQPATTRSASNNAWTFTPADLFCNDPVFVEEEGVIKIKCNTNAAKIYINTESDANPTSGSTLYDPTDPVNATTQNWETTGQVRIKAIAVVSDGTNTASSDVVTLLNMPDITLGNGPYTYKGTEWEPTVTKVSIGTSPNETTAPTTPDSTYTWSSASYSDNTNVGTATLTLTDAKASDLWYIWNASTTFTISPANVTVTADNQEKEYGTNDPTWTATVTGMQNDESESLISYSINRTAGEDVGGTYAITPSGQANQGNYTVTYVAGELTITQRSIGDGSIATGFTYVIESDNSITLKDGETTLTDVDYFVASGSEPTSSGKYTTRTVSGRGNYTGFFNIRNAIVHFKNDNNGGTEYSATFVAESAGATDIGHALPEGMSAYIITDITGDLAITEELDYIPAGVPVVLLANNEINGFEVKNAVLSNDVAEVTETQIGNNMLEEVTEATSTWVDETKSSESYYDVEYKDKAAYFDTKQIYLLYNNEFVWNKAGYLAKWKVYLNPNHATPTQDPDPDPDPEPSPAPSRLKIAWHRASDISNIPTSAIEGRSQWYTIDGRRLSGRPTAKGLYIVEGKKVMIK